MGFWPRPSSPTLVLGTSASGSSLFPKSLKLTDAQIATHKHIILLLLIYSLAGLMVSEVPYYSFKDIHWQSRQPFWLLIAIIVAFKLVIAQPQIALFSVISLYLLSGPVWWLVRRTRRLRRVSHAPAASSRSGSTGAASP